jgi:hypothetical protein
MNFSPYSPSPDEDRSRNAPKKSKPSSSQQTKPSSFSSYQDGQNADSFAEQGLLGSGIGGGSSSNGGNQTIRVNKYETSLPIRVDVEASLAYVLGPVTGNHVFFFFCIN